MELKDKALEALKILKRFNPLNHDTDAYLDDVAEWGLGIIKKKPDPEDYGIENE